MRIYPDHSDTNQPKYWFTENVFVLLQPIGGDK